MEATVHQTFSGLEKEQNVTLDSLQDESDEKEDNPYLEYKSRRESALSLSFATHFRAHSGKARETGQSSPLKTAGDLNQNYEQRVLFALHPTSPIMYTAGEDQQIYLWDIEKSKLLMKSNQGLTPTALKLSPNGEVLAVGFSNGTFVLLNAKLDVNRAGRHGGCKL